MLVPSLPASFAPIAAETVAFIDIGTNSVRLMVVRLEPDHSWTVLTMQKETVRLGEGEFGEIRLLQPRGHGSRRRRVRAVRRYLPARTGPPASSPSPPPPRARRATPASSCACCATTAGLEVHVVSGKEEARLIYLGLLSRVHIGRPRPRDRHRRRQHRGRRRRRVGRRDRRIDLARRHPSRRRGAAAGQGRAREGGRLRDPAAPREVGFTAHAARRRPPGRDRLRHLGHDRESGGGGRAHAARSCSRPRRAAHARGPARGGETPPCDDGCRAPLRAGAVAGESRHHRRRRRHPRHADGGPRHRDHRRARRLRPARGPAARRPRARRPARGSARRGRARAERAAARARDLLRRGARAPGDAPRPGALRLRPRRPAPPPRSGRAGACSSTRPCCTTSAPS